MSAIEWTDESWNPVVGCTRVSAGCDHCYAVTMSHRLGAMAEADRAAGRDPGRKAAHVGLTVLNPRGDRHFNGQVRCLDEALRIPLGWKKPRRVFVNAMGDLFHEAVPFDFIDRVFAVMALCPQHTFQVLTKRADRMEKYLTQDNTMAFRRVCAALHDMGERPATGSWPLPNVCLGVSVEDQAAAEKRIPPLLATPAAVRFLSCEPLLGPVDFNLTQSNAKGDEWFACALSGVVPIDWVIVGGESGKGARPCEVGWIRSIVRQCQDARVPVFVKQVGAAPCDDGYPLRLRDRKGGDPAEWPDDLRVREWPRTGTEAPRHQGIEQGTHASAGDAGARRARPARPGGSGPDGPDSAKEPS